MCCRSSCAMLFQPESECVSMLLRSSVFLFALVAATSSGSFAQSSADKPLPSPAATASTTLDGKSVVIRYNAPSMRGRQIMGGLVPYGKVWRTGANPATTLVTAAHLKIGTLDVPAGTYTIYTLPNASTWMLIVNKQTGQWGNGVPPGAGPGADGDDGESAGQAAGGDVDLV